MHAIPSTHAQCLQNPEARPARRLEPGPAALLLVLISLSVVSSPRRPWSWRENGRPGTTATMFVNVGTISAARIHATKNKRRFISSAGELLPNYQQSQPRLGLEASGPAKVPRFLGGGGERRCLFRPQRSNVAAAAAELDWTRSGRFPCAIHSLMDR